MKIKKLAGGAIRFTAENKKDSLSLLEFLENAAGRGNDPNRLSVKKRKELEIDNLKVGDMVTVNHSHPLSPKLEFKIETFETISGEEMICGEFGCFAKNMITKSV